jgi:hypothetical protein
VLRYWCLVLVAVTASCGLGASDGPLANTAQVRFVNLITDDTKLPVNAFLDTEPFGDSLSFGETSPLSIVPFTSIYKEVNFGQHVIAIRKTADTSVVVGTYAFIIDPPPPEGTALLVAANSVAPAVYPGGWERDRTIIATGGGGFTSFQFSDKNAIPDSGMIRVRVINLSSAASPVDVFVTTPTADLTVAVASATNVRMGVDPPYFTVPAGTWRIRAVRTGTAPADRIAGNVVLNINNQVWDKGARTVILVDNPINTAFARGAVIIDQ